MSPSKCKPYSNVATILGVPVKWKLIRRKIEISMRGTVTCSGECSYKGGGNMFAKGFDLF